MIERAKTWEDSPSGKVGTYMERMLNTKNDPDFIVKATHESTRVNERSIERYYCSPAFMSIPGNGQIKKCIFSHSALMKIGGYYPYDNMDRRFADLFRADLRKWLTAEFLCRMLRTWTSRHPKDATGSMDPKTHSRIIMTQREIISDIRNIRREFNKEKDKCSYLDTSGVKNRLLEEEAKYRNSIGLINNPLKYSSEKEEDEKRGSKGRRKIDKKFKGGAIRNIKTNYIEIV